MKRTVIAGVCLLVFAFGVSAHPYGSGAVDTGFSESLRHGDAHLAAGEFALAVSAYEEAVEKVPYAAEGHLRLARALYSWGDRVRELRSDLWARSVEEAARGRELDPFLAEAGFLEALIYFRTGDYRKALAVYRDLARFREGDPELQIDIALVEFRLGRKKAAVAALERARVLDPSSERLHRVARLILAGW